MVPETMVAKDFVTFYCQYKSLVWVTGGLIVFLLLIIITLLINLILLRKTEEKMRLYATTDTMTGMLNRRTGLLALEELVEKAKNYKCKLTICYIDINNLKGINDIYGHYEGDAAIQVVAAILKESLRKSDMVCRLGGDEFLLIFPYCSRTEAEAIWARIEGGVNHFNSRKISPFFITLSHGFAELDPQKDMSVDDLVRLADDEMYRAKRLLKIEESGEFLNGDF